MDVIVESLGTNFKDEAKKALTRLNEAIAMDEELGEDYTIGAAYLLHLKDKDNANDTLEALWNGYLETIIKEYLKGLLSPKELKEKIASLRDIFLNKATVEQ